MPFVAHLLAKLLICVGIMMTVVSCVIGSVAKSGAGGVPFTGIILIIIGAVLWHRVATKLCPDCAERVKAEARKCRHCGAELGS